MEPNTRLFKRYHRQELEAGGEAAAAARQGMLRLIMEQRRMQGDANSHPHAAPKQDRGGKRVHGGGELRKGGAIRRSNPRGR